MSLTNITAGAPPLSLVPTTTSGPCQIYLAFSRPQTQFQAESLHSQGIRSVIDISGEFDADLFANVGLFYFPFPLIEGSSSVYSTSCSQLLNIIQVICGEINESRTVLLVSSGPDLAAIVFTAYSMYARGYDTTTALDIVTGLRLKGTQLFRRMMPVLTEFHKQLQFFRTCFSNPSTVSSFSLEEYLAKQREYLHGREQKEFLTRPKIICDLMDQIINTISHVHTLPVAPKDLETLSFLLRRANRPHSTSTVTTQGESRRRALSVSNFERINKSLAMFYFLDNHQTWRKQPDNDALLTAMKSKINRRENKEDMPLRVACHLILDWMEELSVPVFTIEEVARIAAGAAGNDLGTLMATVAGVGKGKVGTLLAFISFVRRLNPERTVLAAYFLHRLATALTQRAVIHYPMEEENQLVKITSETLSSSTASDPSAMATSPTTAAPSVSPDTFTLIASATDLSKVTEMPPVSALANIIMLLSVKWDVIAPQIGALWPVHVGPIVDDKSNVETSLKSSKSSSMQLRNSSVSLQSTPTSSVLTDSKKRKNSNATPIPSTSITPSATHEEREACLRQYVSDDTIFWARVLISVDNLVDGKFFSEEDGSILRKLIYRRDEELQIVATAYGGRIDSNEQARFVRALEELCEDYKVEREIDGVIRETRMLDRRDSSASSVLRDDKRSISTGPKEFFAESSCPSSINVSTSSTPTPDSRASIACSRSSGSFTVRDSSAASMAPSITSLSYPESILSVRPSSVAESTDGRSSLLFSKSEEDMLNAISKEVMDQIWPTNHSSHLLNTSKASQVVVGSNTNTHTEKLSKEQVTREEGLTVKSIETLSTKSSGELAQDKKVVDTHVSVSTRVSDLPKMIPNAEDSTQQIPLQDSELLSSAFVTPAVTLNVDHSHETQFAAFTPLNREESRISTAPTIVEEDDTPAPAALIPSTTLSTIVLPQSSFSDAEMVVAVPSTIDEVTAEQPESAPEKQSSDNPLQNEPVRRDPLAIEAVVPPDGEVTTPPHGPASTAVAQTQEEQDSTEEDDVISEPAPLRQSATLSTIMLPQSNDMPLKDSTAPINIPTTLEESESDDIPAPAPLRPSATLSTIILPPSGDLDIPTSEAQIPESSHEDYSLVSSFAKTTDASTSSFSNTPDIPPPSITANSSPSVMSSSSESSRPPLPMTSNINSILAPPQPQRFSMLRPSPTLATILVSAETPEETRAEPILEQNEEMDGDKKEAIAEEEQEEFKAEMNQNEVSQDVKGVIEQLTNKMQDLELEEEQENVSQEVEQPMGVEAQTDDNSDAAANTKEQSVLLQNETDQFTSPQSLHSSAQSVHFSSVGNEAQVENLSATNSFDLLNTEVHEHVANVVMYEIEDSAKQHSNDEDVQNLTAQPNTAEARGDTQFKNDIIETTDTR